MALAWASFNTYLTSPDDIETESACQRTCRPRRKIRCWRVITASASACRLSAASGGVRAIQLRRRSTAVWRSCHAARYGVSIGSCRRSSGDARAAAGHLGRTCRLSNGLRSILTRTPVVRRWNCVASGANPALCNDEGWWPARHYLSQSALELRRPAKPACRGSSGPRPAWLWRKKSAGRKEGGVARPRKLTHAKFREGA